MLRIILFLIVQALLAEAAHALCQLAPDSASPQTLTIAAQTIIIRADAPGDTTTPIASYDSSATAGTIRYINCSQGNVHGKDVTYLTGQDTSTKIYPTRLPGIGIKIKDYNGFAMSDLPSSGTIAEFGSAAFAAGSFFRIEFYKTKETLTLTQATGDELLPGGDLAYSYINSKDVAYYAKKLNTGVFKIISTPVCSTDNARTIDFGTVTPAIMKAGGVERNLDFSLSCKTDYGTWSAIAGIITTTPSSNGKYIKVTDAAKNSDALGIEIYDSTNRLLTVDGSTTEQSAATVSNASVQFNWKAKLIDTLTRNARPQNGQFTARAEIVIQIK